MQIHDGWGNVWGLIFILGIILSDKNQDLFMSRNLLNSSTFFSFYFVDGGVI